MSRKAIDLAGKKFGFLEVLENTSNRCANGTVMWKCKCTNCPEEKIVIVSSGNLKNGTKSCGCYAKEVAKTVARNLGLKNVKHGASMSKYKEGGRQLDYVIWSSMKQRCYDKNSEYYKNYGGRGIKVCKEWKNSFASFAAYIRTLDNCPSETILNSRLSGKRLKISLDRINNNKGYKPNNLKWSSKVEQANNRRNNKMVEYKGNSLTLAQTVRKYSLVPYNVVYKRLLSGWSLHKAMKSTTIAIKLNRKLIRFKRRT